MDQPDGKARHGPPGGLRLGYLLRQAAGVHRLAMERALADLGVTPPQFLVLRLLAETPGSSSSDIARKASLTTATVSVIVANLKRLDAVTTSPHPVHGRIQQLTLSEAGKALLRACGARVVKVETELQAGLPPAEAEKIAGWLRAVAASGT